MDSINRSFGADNPNLSISLCGISWKNPITTASGTWGLGWEESKHIDPTSLGAITPKTITLEPREGHKNPVMVKTEGGMLNAVGLKNPGIHRFLSQDLPALEDIGVPIIVSIAGKTVDEYIELARMLDCEKAVGYVEANVSCPNVNTGMAFGQDPKVLEDLTSKIKQVTVKPVIVKLSPNVTNIVECAKAAESGGADALALINTLMGMKINLKTKRPILTNNTGGLSGPAIKPIALRMVWQVARAVKIPIIGMGGISDANDVLEFIVAGATAVAIGTAAMSKKFSFGKVLDDIRTYLGENGIQDINILRGTLTLN